MNQGQLLYLQKAARLHTLGRLRMGTSTPGANGGKRPQKSETWVISSPNREYVDLAAKLWGGTVEVWQKTPKEREFRVVTATDTLPVYVLPFPPSQSLEKFDDKRRLVCLRCDGVTCRTRGPQGNWTEAPCECDPENNAKPKCGAKLTTRVSFLLPNMPAVGTWMLETHGYYAAVEMPTGMEFVRVSGRLVARALLRLERRQRVDPAGGPDRIFYVPVLHLESEPRHLEALATGDVRSLPEQAKALMGGDPLADLATGYEPDPPDLGDADSGYTEREFVDVLAAHDIKRPEVRQALAGLGVSLARLDDLLRSIYTTSSTSQEAFLRSLMLGGALTVERIDAALADLKDGDV